MKTTPIQELQAGKVSIRALATGTPTRSILSNALFATISVHQQIHLSRHGYFTYRIHKENTDTTLTFKDNTGTVQVDLNNAKTSLAQNQQLAIKRPSELSEEMKNWFNDRKINANKRLNTNNIYIQETYVMPEQEYTIIGNYDQDTQILHAKKIVAENPIQAHKKFHIRRHYPDTVQPL